jgi:hypothetical protein
LDDGDNSCVAVANVIYQSTAALSIQNTVG